MEVPAALRVRGDLPPRDAWLIDPYRDKLDTPVDDRGLVIVDQLIQEVKATLDSSYEYGEKLNEHHFYWYKRWYDSDNYALHTAQHDFRNLGVHKGYLPKSFHNWLHEVTIPPPRPEPEVMAHRVESWRLAQSLFDRSRNIVAQEYRRRIGTGVEVDFTTWEGEMIDWEYMQENYKEQFDRLEPRIRDLALPDGFPELATTDPGEMYHHLGLIATNRTQNLQPLLAA